MNSNAVAVRRLGAWPRSVHRVSRKRYRNVTALGGVDLEVAEGRAGRAGTPGDCGGCSDGGTCRSCSPSATSPTSCSETGAGGGRRIGRPGLVFLGAATRECKRVSGHFLDRSATTYPTASLSAAKLLIFWPVVTSPAGSETVSSMENGALAVAEAVGVGAQRASGCEDVARPSPACRCGSPRSASNRRAAHATGQPRSGGGSERSLEVDVVAPRYSLRHFTG